MLLRLAIIVPLLVSSLAFADDEIDNVDKPIVKPSVQVEPAPKVDDENYSSQPTGVKIQMIDDKGNPIPEDAAASPSPSPAPSPAAAPAHAPARATAKKENKKVEPKAETTKVSAEGVSAEQSLKWLINGNARYVGKKFRGDGRHQIDRDRTAKAQKPHAIVLSCSDSRVPPELIFDQGLGEITTIRVTGEVLDASVIASIESAITRQHPHLLVVLGHTQCDAIESAINWKENSTQGSDALDRIVAEIKPHLKSLNSGAPSAGLQVEGALQADGVARDLTDRSEIIKKAVESGDLKIKSGLYWIDSGKVKFY